MVLIKKSNSCHYYITTGLFDVSNQSPVFNINATAKVLTGTRVLASLHGLTVDFRPYSLLSRLTMVRPHATDVIQCHSAPCILMWTPHTIRTASMHVGIDSTTHIRIAMIHQRIKVVSKNKPFISLQWASCFRGQWAQIPAAQSPQQHEGATARTTSWLHKLIAILNVSSNVWTTYN